MLLYELAGVFMVYGYRLFRILVVVVGFIVGFAVCYILLHEYWTGTYYVFDGNPNCVFFHYFYVSWLVCSFGFLTDPDTWVEIVQIIISIIPGVILSVLLCE